MTTRVVPGPEAGTGSERAFSPRNDGSVEPDASPTTPDLLPPAASSHESACPDSAVRRVVDRLEAGTHPHLYHAGMRLIKGKRKGEWDGNALATGRWRTFQELCTSLSLYQRLISVTSVPNRSNAASILDVRCSTGIVGPRSRCWSHLTHWHKGEGALTQLTTSRIPCKLKDLQGLHGPILNVDSVGAPRSVAVATLQRRPVQPSH